jgi:hypothetical protein
LQKGTPLFLTICNQMCDAAVCWSLGSEKESVMRKTAKLSKKRGSQAVVHARKPESWDELFTLADATDFPAEFLHRRNPSPFKKRRIFPRP